MCALLSGHVTRMPARWPNTELGVAVCLLHHSDLGWSTNTWILGLSVHHAE